MTFTFQLQARKWPKFALPPKFCASGYFASVRVTLCHSKVAFQGSDTDSSQMLVQQLAKKPASTKNSTVV